MQTDAPKHIFVLGSVASEFLNYLISLILVVGVMIATHAPFYFNTIPYMIIPVISLIMMVIGFSLVVSIIAVYYSDIIHLWGVISLLILYTSAIFYPMDILSEPYFKSRILDYWSSQGLCVLRNNAFILKYRQFIITFSNNIGIRNHSIPNL